MEQGPSEKLIGPQLVKKFPTFYGTNRLINEFKEHAKCPYPEADQFSPSPSTPLLEDPVLYYHTTNTFKVASFLQAYPPKPCVHLSSPHMCHLPSPSNTS
jgi:hypothetical protein